MATTTGRNPSYRKLRGYAFDPSLSLKTETVDINELVYVLPWEDLTPGPVGEYVEIIDYDPTIEQFYMAVDLNETYVLVEDGIRPSESNPLFHQQMVYAVSMTTIRNFEKALGRKVIWATRLLKDKKAYEEYVAKLRIYPHGLRESNAYYSPHKKAILFGYFKSHPNADHHQMPNSLVFTCLSHDIIAHEVTHAILDGLYRHYNEPTNPDVLAFHEAFADLIALFQHFTFPEVLKHQIAQTRGNLENQNLLGQLAQEFGSAIGGYGSLRDAIGSINKETKKWEPKMPNPNDYNRTLEPHGRGSILVAAVFDAFLHIYKRRIADLLRISTNGTGILPEGELHPDLVNRMAREASKAAKHILNMCIRALDYCPPVDITFGDYLRAIITADVDLVQNDDKEYRLAFIDAFRKRGIYPKGIKTLSIDSLRQEETNIVLENLRKLKSGDTPKGFPYAQISEQTKRYLSVINDFLKDYGDTIKYIRDRKEIYEATKKFIGGSYDDPEKLIQGLHSRIVSKFSHANDVDGSYDFSALTGLIFNNDFSEFGIKSSYNETMPSFQIQSLRLISRVGPNGNLLNHVVFSIIQKSGVIVRDGKFFGHFIPDVDEVPEGGFILYGGCTLIFDMDENQLRYVISKPLIDREKMILYKHCEIDATRVENQYHYQFDDGLENRGNFNKYFGIDLNNSFNEPFAMLHNH